MSGTVAAVLAAGRAARFGRAKLDEPCAGRPLGRWAVAAAMSAELPVLIVTGRASQWMTGAGCETVLNPKADEGIGTSVALAAETALAMRADNLLLLLGDMPLVGADLVRRLMASGAPAACRYPDGRAGVPAFLPHTLFTDLARLSGDRGAGAILARLDGLTLCEADPRELLDVDTPDGLRLAETYLAAGR